jgi:hypothetical protein
MNLGAKPRGLWVGAIHWNLGRCEVVVVGMQAMAKGRGKWVMRMVRVVPRTSTYDVDWL